LFFSRSFCVVVYFVTDARQSPGGQEISIDSGGRRAHSSKPAARHGDQQCHIVGQCRKLSGGVFIVQACAGLNGMQLGDKKLVVQRASVGKNPGSVRDMMLSCVWIISPVDIVPLSERFDTQ